MTSETTTNELVIQGILKEALLHEKKFNVVGLTKEFYFKLVDLIEGSLRGNSTDKKLVFIALNGDVQFKVGQDVKMQTRFHRCVAEGMFKLEKYEANSYIFSVPAEIELINQRKASRTKLSPELKGSVSVFLNTNGWHSDASFEIDNVSDGGYGGILWVRSGFLIEPSTKITGTFRKNQTLAHIDGLIQNARLLNSERVGYDCYQIGIVQDRKKNHNGTNLRRQVRYKSNFTIDIVSLFFPDQRLRVEVQDISINGFSGVISDDTSVLNVPVGAVFEVAGEKTKVKLVHFANGRYHFHIENRKTSDGIEWLRKMTPLIHPGARCSSKDLNELYRVFLQAGAISTEYLKTHQLHQNLLVSERSDPLMSRYLHRWFIYGTNENADAYISAIRIGNVCWAVGDLVKTAGSQLKMDDSIRSFFQSFAEFAHASDSISSLMAVWVKGHPYWNKWLDALRADNQDLVKAEIRMAYVRCGKPAIQIDKSIDFVEIKKDDWKLRSNTFSRLGKRQQVVMAEAFDFSPSISGSAVYGQDCEWFSRRYIVIKFKGKEYLAVVTAVLPGISINRYLDSLFLSPLDHDSKFVVTASDLTEIADYISANFSIKIPSVRLMYEQGNAIDATEMTALVLLPRGFNLF